MKLAHVDRDRVSTYAEEATDIHEDRFNVAGW